jgi:hypothetical protein
LLEIGSVHSRNLAFFFVNQSKPEMASCPQPPLEDEKPLVQETDVTTFRRNLVYTLSQYMISDLPAAHRQLTTITANKTLGEGFKRLIEDGILSAPVMMRDDPPTYAGFLDLRGLIASVVYAYDSKGENGINLDDLMSRLSKCSCFHYLILHRAIIIIHHIRLWHCC